MNQQHVIDVRKVIEGSTQVKTLRELEKEGRHAVKVVRTGKISELIEQAVENVIAERSMRVVEEEKNALIQATGEEFRRLLRDADEERKKSEQIRGKMIAYEKEILELKHKLEMSEHVHSEDLRLLDEQKTVVDELRETVKHLKGELEEIVERLRSEEGDRQEMDKRLEDLRDENHRLREDLARSEEQRKVDEERLVVLREQTELERKGSHEKQAIQGLVDEVKSIREAFLKGLADRPDRKDAKDGEDAEGGKGMLSKIESVISTKMDQIAKQVASQFGQLPAGKTGAPVEAARIVLDNLFTQKDEIESNLSKLQVKSTEATGIGQNLDRLKKLHRKGLGKSTGDPKATE
jgi:hypothetical protein